MSHRRVQERITRACHHIPDSCLLYVENPKVACSNVKWSLVHNFSDSPTKPISNIHNRKTTPFFSNINDIIDLFYESGVRTFSIVRHPRQRFKSAYFDKMWEGRDQSVWRHISGQLDLELDSIYEPKIILSRMMNASSQDIDPHIAKQVINLFFGSIPFDRIFQLEELNGQDDPISVGGITFHLEQKQNHSTKDRRDEALFDSEADEMIDHIYADDYDAFGYRPDVDAPTSQVKTVEERPLLLDLLHTRTPLRVLSEYFQDGPRELSYLEVGGIIDILSAHNAWSRLSHRHMDYIVARNAVRYPDNIARFVSSYTEFPSSREFTFQS